MLTRLLAGLMGLAARRPLAVAGTVLVLAAAGAVLAHGPRAARGHRHARRPLDAGLRRDAGPAPDASATTPSTSSCASPSSRVVLTEDLSQRPRARGLPVGQRAGRAHAAGRPGRPVRAARRDEAGEGRVRAGDVPQRGRRPDLRPVHRRQHARSSARPRAPSKAAYKLARARGSSPSPPRRPTPRRPSSSSPRSSTATSWRWRSRYGITSPPSLNDPRFISRLVFDSRRGVDTPKARFASIFPGREGALIQVRLRDGLSEQQRKRAIADIRAATRMPHWRLSAGDVRRHRRAGRRRAALALDLALDDRAAARRRARDGADAAARLPRAPAAAAAARRALRDRDHVRRDVAARRPADDGVDRRDPGADRPRGGLRDPAAVAAAGARRRRSRRRSRASRARARRRS